MYLCRCTPTLPTGFLTIKMSYTVLRYTSECTAFPGPIFTDLTNGQQHYVQSSYNEFGPNWTNKNWKVRRETHLRPYAKLEFYCTNFYKTHSDSLNCCGHLPYRILSTSEESVESAVEFSFTTTRKVWHLLCLFSRSSKMHGINKCRLFCAKFY
jgi:hypothetical protein